MDKTEYRASERALRMSIKAINPDAWVCYQNDNQFSGWVNFDRWFLWYCRKEGLKPIDGNELMKHIAINQYPN